MPLDIFQILDRARNKRVRRDGMNPHYIVPSYHTYRQQSCHTDRRRTQKAQTHVPEKDTEEMWEKNVKINKLMSLHVGRIQQEQNGRKTAKQPGKTKTWGKHWEKEEREYSNIPGTYVPVFIYQVYTSTFFFYSTIKQLNLVLVQKVDSSLLSCANQV